MHIYYYSYGYRVLKETIYQKSNLDFYTSGMTKIHALREVHYQIFTNPLNSMRIKLYYVLHCLGDRFSPLLLISILRTSQVT